MISSEFCQEFSVFKKVRYNWIELLLLCKTDNFIHTIIYLTATDIFIFGKDRGRATRAQIKNEENGTWNGDCVRDQGEGEIKPPGWFGKGAQTKAWKCKSLFRRSFYLIDFLVKITLRAGFGRARAETPWVRGRKGWVGEANRKW